MSTGTIRYGRQAQAAVNDERVLAAAREVFATAGYDAAVGAVAEAAGVGIGSLYRRYGSKDELLAEVCLRSMQEMAAIAAAARENETTPIARLETFVRQCVAVRCGAFAGVAGRIPVSATMIAAARRSQRLATELVAAAQADGSVRGDVTVVDVLRLIELFGRAPRPVGESPVIAARLLALALAGLRGTGPGATGPRGIGAEPLPGPPPTLRGYRARWSPAAGKGLVTGPRTARG